MPGEYDAASETGQMAGLGAGEDASQWVLDARDRAVIESGGEVKIADGRLRLIDGKLRKLPPLVTPEHLAKAFTTDVSPGLVARSGVERDEALRCTIHRGFCGYNGHRGDSLLTGFDDGYDFMGYLEARGWKALASKGDWPYVVYLTYTPREPYAIAEYSIAEYCEADFTLWTFDDAAAAAAFVKTLRDSWWA